MIPVVTPREMRSIDARASESLDTLVARAGAAVAREALDLMGGGYGRTVVVIAGPGNNGADGRVAAVRLRARGLSVRVFDPTDLPTRLPPADLVIDAAFGTGFRDRWAPPVVAAGQVLAVDIPSGLDGLTGRAMPGTIAADRTVTFAAVKPGHVLADGPDLVGQLVVADIGLPTDGATIHLVRQADVAAWLPDRRRNAHKWSTAVRVIAGSTGMPGAAQLTTAAAQRAGAGMVVLSSPGGHIVTSVEVVNQPLQGDDWMTELDDLDRFHALVIGPGLGREPEVMASAAETVGSAPIPVVVDGDALFALSGAGDVADVAVMSAREPSTVLTPHDGEFRQLTGQPPADDRIADVRRLAAATDSVVLLKGPTTIVAAPSGAVWLVVDGDQRLATAGSGDVLAGIIGALLAQRLPADRAAAAGAWIHAAAANRAPRRGLIASDLLATLPAVLESLDG